jgi:hypothetical protein
VPAMVVAVEGNFLVFCQKENSFISFAMKQRQQSGGIRYKFCHEKVVQKVSNMDF